MAFDHREILSSLDELMKPISTVKISDQEQEQEQILTINLIFSNACDRFHQSNPSLISTIPLDNDQPIVYHYVQIHLYLLEILVNYENEQNSSSSSSLPLFSIQDETIISRSLSFVVLLGLILNFDEGISLSFEQYLAKSATSLHLMKLKSDQSHHQRFLSLQQTLDRLIRWIRMNEKLNTISQRLISYHFLEILLGHLQLLYSPNLKYSTIERSNVALEENLHFLRRQYSKQFIQELMFVNQMISKTINSPAWLRQRCGELLTSILIDKDHQGIRRIFQTILDSTSSNVSTDRLYTSLAQILSTCPKQMTPENYFKEIQSELMELLQDPRYIPIISIAINQFYVKYPLLMETEVFPVLFRPLFVIISPMEIITEDQWNFFLHNFECLTETVSSDRLKTYLLDHHLSALINIYLAVEKSLLAFKQRFFRIFVNLFSSMSKDQCLDYFQSIFFRTELIPVRFQTDFSGQISLSLDRMMDENGDIFTQSINQLLFAIENHNQWLIQLFLRFLQSLTTKMDLQGTMIWGESERKKSIQQYFIMEILRSLSEYFAEHIDLVIENTDDTIRVLQIIFEKFTETSREQSSRTTIEKYQDDDSSDEEVLQMVLTIASLFITHYDQLSFENKHKLASLYPPLIWIENHHVNEEVRRMAHELSLAFVTFGAIKSPDHQATDSSIDKPKVLIQDLDDQRDLREEKFANAFSCLQDASLPIRAHGLILFRRLIERSDQETLEKIDSNLLERFEEHLKAEDSYEYLAAINVFSALADRYPDRILPVLSAQYLNRNESIRKLEDQLKVGEILVKASKSLGDMSSKYASLLINTFLHASKSTNDSLYRASALSNLGQLCHVLKYSLTKDLSEILLALKNYLSIFESPEVRRASILVCELLCESLDKSSWLTVLDYQLPSFYQLIKQLYRNDRDEIVRLHAQIALETLNEVCRDYLQMPMKLEKQIRILS